MSKSESASFESWAIVEVMGHRRFSGYVTEQQIGGTSFVRVDVPELPADDSGGHVQAFTKLLGAGSIYCITPCDEQIARATARTSGNSPLHELQLPSDWQNAMRVGRRVLEAKALQSTETATPATDSASDEYDEDATRDFYDNIYDDGLA
jgi:hypothetical protein